jgi:hypothetical protein
VVGEPRVTVRNSIVIATFAFLQLVARSTAAQKFNAGCISGHIKNNKTVLEDKYEE